MADVLCVSPSSEQIINPLLTSLMKPNFWVLKSTRPCFINKILVSKETVVLRRWWEIETEIDFIKRVDKGRITTVKDLES